MEEIKIYESPLSDGEHKEHSIAGLIRQTPIRYHLIDVVKELKHGRPAKDQKMIDEWIAMMELSDRGAPFSYAIVNAVWKKAEKIDNNEFMQDAEDLDILKMGIDNDSHITSIDIDGEALNTLLYIGDFDGGIGINVIFDEWKFEDNELEAIESLELFRDWSLYTLHNINNDRIDHDGSMYDSQVFFISPEGAKYMAEDTHCLMTGWNFDQKVTLKLI